MPGPTGGGRSGGGGGFSGGSHGGFSGGSHGGFSSGSHRSFGSGAHRPVGGFYNLNTNNNDPEQEKKNNVKGIIFLIISLVAIFGGPAASMVGNVISDFGAHAQPDIWAEVDSVIGMEEEPLFDIGTAPRARLDESLCKPVDVWYFDMAELFESEGEGEMVEHALSYFYEKTGVQPLLVTANYIDGTNAPSWDTVEGYLYDLYIELFGADEGHYIFLYFEHSDSSYTLYYIPGLDAMTVVDDNASAILMDYIEWYYQEASSYGEMFASAFADAADMIMYVPEEYTSAVPAAPDNAEMTTYPPASTVPPAEVDSSVNVTVPAVELTSEPESDEAETAEPESAVESTGTTVEVTPTQESTTEILWEDDVYEEPEEDFISSEALGAIFVIAVAVTAFVVFVLWNKKKMRDLENDM